MSFLDPDTREQWAKDAERERAREKQRAWENERAAADRARDAQTPDAALRRAAVVSELVTVLVKVDASERASVVAAAMAVIGNAPPQAHTSAPNPAPTYTAR